MAGRARSGGALGLAIVAAMLMLFLAFLLSLPLSTAWDEDACMTNRPGREQTTITQGHSLWPPGSTCRYVGPHGRPVERFVDAGTWDPLKWPVLALLAGAPLTLGAGLFASIRGLRAGGARERPRGVGGITT
ncbi:MAG TPA: hypothetical protein VEK39_12600 [Solirubrobacterales bacterium]|nr:hypothetical protein [Solirubrobacterales bacterium]